MGWAARAKVSAGNPERLFKPRGGHFINDRSTSEQLRVLPLARIRFSDREYAMTREGQLRRLEPGGSIPAEEKADVQKQVWGAVAKALERDKQTPGGSVEPAERKKVTAAAWGALAMAQGQVVEEKPPTIVEEPPGGADGGR